MQPHTESSLLYTLHFNAKSPYWGGILITRGWSSISRSLVSIVYQGQSASLRLSFLTWTSECERVWGADVIVGGDQFR